VARCSGFWLKSLETEKILGGRCEIEDADEFEVAVMAGIQISDPTSDFHSLA
jgi:hypothetical protein